MSQEQLNKSSPIVGSTVIIDSDILDIVNESIKNAEKHEWLYHCTNINNLFNIINSREFWLRNLKDVNDKVEYKRIDVSSYINSYFVACFTYADNISESHWEEYGNLENGILFSVKKDWFSRNAIFMDKSGDKFKDESYCIFSCDKDACEYLQHHRYDSLENTQPFYIKNKKFYQIKYDNDLVKNMANNSVWSVGDIDIEGVAITPEIVGIIKRESGICEREGQTPYVKDWTIEKEVRIKVCIKKFGNDTLIPYFPWIAVPLNDNAFNELKIRFAPKMPKEKQKEYKEQLESRLGIEIECLND